MYFGCVWGYERGSVRFDIFMGNEKLRTDVSEKLRREIKGETHTMTTTH